MLYSTSSILDSPQSPPKIPTQLLNVLNWGIFESLKNSFPFFFAAMRRYFRTRKKTLLLEMPPADHNNKKNITILGISILTQTHKVEKITRQVSIHIKQVPVDRFTLSCPFIIEAFANNFLTVDLAKIYSPFNFRFTTFFYVLSFFVKKFHIYRLLQAININYKTISIRDVDFVYQPCLKLMLFLITEIFRIQHNFKGKRQVCRSSPSTDKRFEKLINGFRLCSLK